MAFSRPLVLATALAAAPALAQPLPPPDLAPRPAAVPAATPAAPGVRPPPRASVLEELAGTLRAVDRRANRVEIETAGGLVVLGLDRNTMVYTPRGLGTVVDLAAGATVRAGRNADFLAYWIQVRGPAPSGEPGSGPKPAAPAAAPPPSAPGGAGAPPPSGPDPR